MVSRRWLVSKLGLAGRDVLACDCPSSDRLSASVPPTRDMCPSRVPCCVACSVSASTRRRAAECGCNGAMSRGSVVHVRIESRVARSASLGGASPANDLVAKFTSRLVDDRREQCAASCLGGRGCRLLPCRMDLPGPLELSRPAASRWSANPPGQARDRLQAVSAPTAPHSPRRKPSSLHSRYLANSIASRQPGGRYVATPATSLAATVMGSPGR